MSVQEDKELQRFLEGDDPVSQAYRDLPSDEPPAALDALILESAREEAKRPVRPRWFVPVSVAATVVLGVGFSVKQLSAPLQSVSDIAYAPVAQESMGDTNLRSANTGVPVPKPSLDALLESNAEPEGRMKKIEVNTDALREQALSAQSFEIKLDPGALGESIGRAAANSDDSSEFAEAPPPRPARKRVAAQPASVAAAPVAEAREETITEESRQENADLWRAFEDSRRPVEEQKPEGELRPNFSSTRMPRSLTEPTMQFADEIDKVAVSGALGLAQDTPLSTQEQALIDQALKRIARQWRLGRTDEAQAHFRLVYGIDAGFADVAKRLHTPVV